MMKLGLQCKDCGWPQGDKDAWKDEADRRVGERCPKCGGLMCDLDWLLQYDRAKLAAWCEAAKP